MISRKGNLAIILFYWIFLNRIYSEVALGWSQDQCCRCVFPEVFFKVMGRISSLLSFNSLV